jgi:hypothetical protein
MLPTDSNEQQTYAASDFKPHKNCEWEKIFKSGTVKIHILYNNINNSKFQSPGKHYQWEQDICIFFVCLLRESPSAKTFVVEMQEAVGSIVFKVSLLKVFKDSVF